MVWQQQPAVLRCAPYLVAGPRLACGDVLPAHNRRTMTTRTAHQQHHPPPADGVHIAFPAAQAARAGCHAIILSNHGGRNLDTSRSGIEVLPEVMKALHEAGLDDAIEVFVDGGIRRGTDVLKVG